MGNFPKPFMVSQENVHILKGPRFRNAFVVMQHEVRENVPLFREKVSVSHMPMGISPVFENLGHSHSSPMPAELEPSHDKGDKDSGYSPYFGCGDPEEVVEDNPSGEATRER